MALKIINYGENYEIYPDDLHTYEELPAGTYKIAFHPMSGFSLVRTEDLQPAEGKIYGNHPAKVRKVLRSFEAFDRSLGVILSGEKGMGKSLFVQLLAQEVVAKGLPVVLVTKSYPGVGEFIDRIDQRAMILFDEFEKVFSIDDKEQGETQNDLLGLFDGISRRKRLYAITVNKLQKLSEFMLSRTGRFHYHIRFDYPDPEEIVTYLRDQLDPAYYEEIQQVVMFSDRIKLNYDNLRAVALELNQGYTFKEAIQDLNILITDTRLYDVKITLSDGKTETLPREELNLFAPVVQVDGYWGGEDFFTVEFASEHLIGNQRGVVTVDGRFCDLNFGGNTEYLVEGVSVSGVEITHSPELMVNYRL